MVKTEAGRVGDENNVGAKTTVRRRRAVAVTHRKRTSGVSDDAKGNEVFAQENTKVKLGRRQS
jgi:hypothetical protein